MNNKISFIDILRKQSKASLAISIVVIVFFVALLVIYNLLLLNSVTENVIKKGQLASERSAKEFDEFLADCSNSITLAEFTLDDIITSGGSGEEIQKFLKQQTASLKHTIGQETTVLYAYVNGQIYDGTDWVPDADYDATKRPWYIKAMSDKGKFVVVDPYIDARTGNILITISKTMSDGESVIALDVTTEYIQNIIEQQSAANKDLTAMVLDSSANVVAHSDNTELGKKYSEETGTLGAVIAANLKKYADQFFEIKHGGHRYTAYIVPIHESWYSVSVIASSDEYMPIRTMFLLTIAASVLTVCALIFIMIRSGSKEIIAGRLNSQLSSAADIYMSLGDIDLETNTFIPIKNIDTQVAVGLSPDPTDVQKTFNSLMNSLPDTPTKKAAVDFVDLSTLEERIGDKPFILLEYESFGGKWVRARFVPSVRKPNGKLSHVLWMLEDIDAEKQERDRLTEKADQLTKQLSSAADIYISLCDLDIPNNSAVAIKNANPAIAKAVEAGKNDMQATFFGIMRGLPESPTKQAAIDFCDLSKINEKLKDTNTITVEYLSYGNIWVRGRYVVSERDENGNVIHVLWMLENIDAEKRARDKLTEQTVLLTKQLASAADIYISLCDLDIPNNSAVGIRNANPAIAKAVEAGKNDMQATFFGIMRGLPESPTKQAAIDFCDLSKIDEKLKDTNTITVEYLSYGNIWVRGRYVVSERDKNGNVIHVLWMLENIDAEKRARDKLTKQTELLTKQLASAADIYISLCDLDIPNNSAVGIRNANPAIAKAVEAGKNDMQATFFGIMRGLPESPTKQAAIDFCDLSKIDEKLKDTNTITVEYLSYGNIWVRGRYVVSERDENGNVIHVLWMLENIDAEKRSRDRLSAAAEKLNNQISSIANIYMTAYDFDLTNDTFSQVRKSTNRSVTDLVGESSSNAQKTLYMVMEKITDADTWPSVRDFWDLSTLDERIGDSKSITREYMSNEQTWRRARFIESERAPDGKLCHVLLVAEDIDNEKKARDKLIDMSERAVAANEAKSAFLSNMSHEIRTPINAVLGMNEMVLRESSDPAVISYSESIRTAGTTLLGLINDILDFSKIEAGKMEIIPVDYDLATVLSDLVNMIQTRLDNKGLMLITDFDKTTPHLLHGDEVRIKQIITNILTNAVKYTEQGSVTFSVTYEKIADEPDSMMLKVAIKDTGIGIKPEDMAKLFSKFERIEEERNRTIEGTGLGMSITQSLLSMMNSKLDVSSVYGEGSVFGFTLKQKVRKWDALGDYEEAHKRSVASRKKYQEKFTAPDAKVLVVDDTKMNLLVFTSLLKSTQIRIDTAESGDDGIALALRNKYDIIFLDHMMPNKDGIETLKELHTHIGHPNEKTPVICLTANAISGAREKYIEAGFDDYLTKPIESAKLEEMICEYLPQEKIHAANTPSKSKEKPKAVIPDGLFDITELDTVSGIRRAGSEEMYLNMLKAYSDMMINYTSGIENYWLSADIKNMTIMLHSLKSASRAVGAEWIKRYAQKLEEAGKAGDDDTINKEIEELLFRCRALGARITSVIGEKKE